MRPIGRIKYADAGVTIGGDAEGSRDRSLWTIRPPSARNPRGLGIGGGQIQALLGVLLLELYG